MISFRILFGGRMQSALRRPDARSRMHLLRLHRCFSRASATPPTTEPTPSQTTMPADIKEHHAEKITARILKLAKEHKIAEMEAAISEYWAATGNAHDQMLYATILEGYMRASLPNKALSFFNAVVANGFHPSVHAVEVLLASLLRMGDERNAQVVMEALPKFQLEPRTKTINIWIQKHLNDGQPEHARAWFKELSKRGLQPDSETFLLSTRYFIQEGNYSAAQKIRQFMKDSGVVPNVYFYHSLISLLLTRNSPSEAEALLTEMKANGIRPNQGTYYALIRGYGQLGNEEKVDALVKEMEAQGIPLTTTLFNILLSVKSPSTRAEGTRGILVKMSELGLTFNNATYAAVVQSLLRDGLHQEAIEMLFEMERKKVILTSMDYYHLLRMCCDLKLTSGVAVLWQQMNMFDVPPTLAIYALLIRYYLRQRNYHTDDPELQNLGYKRVDALLLEMQRKWNLRPNSFIYTILLEHYVEHLDFESMLDLIKKIKESGVEINNTMYSVIMKAFYSYCDYHHGGHIFRVKGAPLTLAQLKEISDPQEIIKNFDTEKDPHPLNLNMLKTQFEKIFGLPFRPTVHVYNEMMLSFFVKDRFEEMFDCLKEMRRSDISPNILTFTLMIKARNFQGDPHNARQMLHEMKRLGMQPLLLHCALIFHTFCKRLETEAAETFFEEIEKVHHLKPNHIFYGSLIFAYVKKQEYSKVFSTFEKMERNGFIPDSETCNYVICSLIEIGELPESRKFFEKMIAQGIPRNSFTYTFMADSYLSRNEPQPFLKLLSDCTQEGNSIDAYPFNRIMSFFYERNDVDKIKEVLGMMIEFGVRFDKDCMSFISIVYQKKIRNIDEWPFLHTLLQKAAVDLDADSPVAKWMEVLMQSYVHLGMDEEKNNMLQFLGRLPEIRKYWLTVPEEIDDVLSGQFRKQQTFQLLTRQPESELEALRIKVEVDNASSKSAILASDLLSVVK